MSKFKAYEERQKAKGMKKIHVWIPVDQEDNVKRYCERKRKAHEKAQA